MEEVLEYAVPAVCGADPQLGAEWHELLGSSTPSAEDGQWVELVERITQVAGDAGVPTDGLMAALVDVRDPGELQAAIASVVWPETAAGEPEGTPATEQSAEAVAAQMAQEDPEAWNAFLRTNGAAWDGNDESWPAFVEWFLYYATEQGVGASARTFCDYATATGPRQVLADYGVTIAAAAGDDGAAESAAPAMTVDQAVATYGTELFAEFRKQNPELADTTDDELKVMMAQVLSGQTT